MVRLLEVWAQVLHLQMCACSACGAAGRGPASPLFYRPGWGEPLGMDLGPDPQPECFLLSKSLPCATISHRPKAAAQSQKSLAVKCKSPSTELQGLLSHAWGRFSPYSSSSASPQDFLLSSTFFFLSVLRGLWDLSSPTRDWTHAPYSGSLES